MFKKAVNSEGIIVIGNSSLKDKFLTGFSWRVGGIIYTVKEVIRKDPNLQMRRVSTSDGSVEDMDVNTIVRDLKEADAQVLSEGDTPKKEETIKKAAAKKKTEKRVKKKKAKK
ncbi:hypothetical protein LCGC14_2486330 [marine sediment metagenome]|uniref:Uncharacterized protein n=1 Tax=marine sediment metagenome TaxID=412755 RepID=A0A0F9B611_9ZZZZ